ncbi:MAG: serine/threonine protein kinase [Planctomycetota bacterium]|nr:MAG: serine/threonine protein kinase [Planctomycetota bacterium]
MGRPPSTVPDGWSGGPRRSLGRSSSGSHEALPPRIGPYLLEGELGRGGMGRVYSARHAQTGAKVAVKLLLEPCPELFARFQREVEAQARADRHPSVLRIHTAGLADGRAYVVMDLAPGGSLEERLRRGPLAPLQAAALVRDLARGLAHAHACGVLHRDLKPANVLFGERGEPLLTDFGPARLAGSDRLTRTGEVLGTPAAMAPEQALGEVDRIDERTDVYGLGALLYACLSGRLPFEGGTLIATLDRVVHQAPQAPSSVQPGVPSALEELCLAALAKDPADRPPSAAAFADALDAFLAGAGAPTTPRRRGVLLAGALAVGALAVGVLAAALLARSPRAAAPTPAAARPEPGAAADRATERRALGPVARAEALLARGEVAGALRLLREAAPIDPAACLRLLRIGREHPEAGVSEEERSRLLAGLALRPASKDPDLEAEVLTALFAPPCRFPQDARRRFRAWAKAHGRERPARGRALARQALKGLSPEARGAFYEDLAALHRDLPSAVSLLAEEAISDLAQGRSYGGTHLGADRAQDPLQLLLELAKKDHPEALYLHTFVVWKFGLGSAAEVRRGFQRAARAGNPDAPWALSLLAAEQGREEEQRKFLDKAVACKSRPGLVWQAVLLADEDPERARTLLERRLPLWRNPLGPEYDYRARAHCVLGKLLLRGSPSPTERARALELLRGAAGAGNAEARELLESLDAAR